MKHKHAELIKAWADGAIIQYYDGLINKFVDEPENIPNWSIYQSYRVKPSDPDWPETTLSPDFLQKEWCSFEDGLPETCKHIANLAIKHAIITGQVILPEEKQ